MSDLTWYSSCRQRAFRTMSKSVSNNVKERFGFEQCQWEKTHVSKRQYPVRDAKIRVHPGNFELGYACNVGHCFKFWIIATLCIEYLFEQKVDSWCYQYIAGFLTYNLRHYKWAYLNRRGTLTHFANSENWWRSSGQYIIFSRYKTELPGPPLPPPYHTNTCRRTQSSLISVMKFCHELGFPFQNNHKNRYLSYKTKLD